MKKDIDKWKDDVLNSMKGSRRAVPPLDLFAKIEAQIDTAEARVIPMRQWSYAVAASLLVLMLNVFALRQIIRSNTGTTTEQVATTDAEQVLISNYNIYE